ncbi:MAG: Trypsin-like peptidase domain, partial [Pseudomonadota bacterium]
MYRSKIILLILSQVVHFGCKSRASRGQSKELYPTSLQRPANELEKGYVGKIETCSGFFVQSSQNRTLFMTARHCFEQSVSREPEDQVHPTGTTAAKRVCAHPQWGEITDGLGQKLTCKELVAGDDEFHDVLLFEMKEQRSGPALRLAGFEPTVGTKLKMIGYPSSALVGDNSFPWAVENCKVYATSVASAWENTPGKVSKDVSFLHDCSTYGGNSGGPILIEGTDIVVGMPTTYDTRIRKDDGMMNYKKEGSYSYAAAVSDFASAHRRKLLAAGITTVESDRNIVQGSGPDYFQSGVFKGEKALCLNIRALYRLGQSLDAVSIGLCGQSKLLELGCSK